MKNERYHGPLIENPVSLAYIKLFPWIALFLSGFMLVGSLFEDKRGVLTVLFLLCTLISLISILLSFIKKFIYRFQSFTYLLIALIVLSLLLDLNFIGLMMFVNGGEVFSRVYSFASAIYVIVMLVIFIIACSLYAWHYLPKNQGKVWKINQWETYGVKGKSKKGQFATNFWPAFGAIIFLGSLITGYIQNVFGIFLGVLMSSTFPAVFVDALYAAVYVRKHPESE